MRTSALILLLVAACGGILRAEEEAAGPVDPEALLGWVDELGWPDFAS